MQRYSATKAFVPTNLLPPTSSGGSGKSEIKGRDCRTQEVLVWTIIHTFTPLQAVHAEPKSVHFSKPFTVRNPEDTPASARLSQLSVMSPWPSLDMSEPIRGRRLTIADSKASLPATDSTATTTQTPLDFDLSPTARSSESGCAPETERRSPQVFCGSHAYSSSSLALDVPPPQPAKNARFYSDALSEEDMEALARGELNHNLKVYTPKDMVMHHESRKALVPQGPGVSKLRKMDALAHIEREKQHSQQALNKKVRGSAILSSFRSTNEEGEHDRIAYHSQATQSMYDLRSPSAPAPQRQHKAPQSPPPPTLSRKFSFDATSPPSSQASHIRASNNGDYFLHRVWPLSTLLPSSPSSGSSSRVRSPLVQEVPRHHHNPSATFDALLAPHKSGKGEVLRDSPNAKKVKGSTSDAGTSAVKLGQSPPKDKKHRHRFNKVPSMLNLKKHSSRCDLRKDISDDIPNVPPLP
jgi:hypothetical protein